MVERSEALPLSLLITDIPLGHVSEVKAAANSLLPQEGQGGHDEGEGTPAAQPVHRRGHGRGRRMKGRRLVAAAARNKHKSKKQ